MHRERIRKRRISLCRKTTEHSDDSHNTGGCPDRESVLCSAVPQTVITMVYGREFIPLAAAAD